MTSYMESISSHPDNAVDDPATTWCARARCWDAARSDLNAQLAEIVRLAQVLSDSLDDVAGEPHQHHQQDWLQKELSERRQRYWDRFYAEALAAANDYYGGAAGTVAVTVDDPRLPAVDSAQAEASMAALWAWYAAAYGQGRGADQIWTEHVVAFAHAINLYNRYTRAICSEVITARKDGAITFQVRASVDSYYHNQYRAYGWREDWEAVCASLEGFVTWLQAEMQGEQVRAVDCLIKDLRTITTGHQDHRWGSAWVSPFTHTHTVYRIVTLKGRIKITMASSLASLLSTWVGLYLPAAAAAEHSQT